MKIAFQLNTLCHRGTTVAVNDYAKYNQELLNNESIILYDKNFTDPGVSHDSLTIPSVLESLEKKYNVIGYTSISDLNNICEKNQIDMTYFIKSGRNDGLVTNCTKNLIHAVFQQFDPHGDRYAYISSWLSLVMSNNTVDYVPHIVSLPETPKRNLRKELGISDDKIVIGRHGGLYQFDIRFVMEILADIAIKDPSFVFLFVNTHKFIDHPSFIFLDPIIDLQEKTDFILACDAMVHARVGGESFGLAICEFLFHNKPVFAWESGTDLHHVDLLNATGNLYNHINLKEKILGLKDKQQHSYDYRGIVEQFSPKNVMDKFETVFIK